MSAESRTAVIDELFKNRAINGYVRKARRDAQYLKEALHAAQQDKSYQSPEIKQSIREKNSHEFSTLDIHIISYCHKEYAKRDPSLFARATGQTFGIEQCGETPQLDERGIGIFKNEQLIAYSKDIGLI